MPKTRFYCFNECPVNELSLSQEDERKCPCCSGEIVDANEHDDEVRQLEDEGRAADEEDIRLYGDWREDVESMNYRPQVITNDAGEPIGWG